MAGPEVGRNGWRWGYKLAAGIGALLPLIGALIWLGSKVEAVAQVPSKVDDLKAAHDTQTAILREQLRLARCLVIYGQAGCVALAKEGDP